MTETDAEFVADMEWLHSHDREAVLPPEKLSRLFALARRGAAVQWRPIEKAPKGPENIFGIEPWGSRWIGAQLWWDDMVEEWTDVHSDRYRKPTHWMPLPPPPAGETNEV